MYTYRVGLPLSLGPALGRRRVFLAVGASDATSARDAATKFLDGCAQQIGSYLLGEAICAETNDGQVRRDVLEFLVEMFTTDDVFSLSIPTEQLFVSNAGLVVKALHPDKDKENTSLIYEVISYGRDGVRHVFEGFGTRFFNAPGNSLSLTSFLLDRRLDSLSPHEKKLFTPERWLVLVDVEVTAASLAAAIAASSSDSQN